MKQQIFAVVVAGVAAGVGYFAAKPAQPPAGAGQQIVTNTIVVDYGDSATSPIPEITTVAATCPMGKVVSGGGYTSTSQYGQPAGPTYHGVVSATESYPTTADTWFVRFPQQQTLTSLTTLTAYAVCVSP